MSEDVLSLKKFIKAVSLSLNEWGIQFFHDYGDLYIPWDSITHAFAVVQKRKIDSVCPLFILVSGGTQTYYYIDGNMFNFKTLKLEGDLSSSLSPQQTSFQETRKSREFNFRKLVELICSCCNAAYFDHPLIAYLRGGMFFLPTYATMKEIADYCARVMDSVTGDEERGASALLEKEDEVDLAGPAAERQEWHPGEIIDGQYTVQDVFRGAMGTVYIVLDSETVTFYAIKTFQEAHLWNERVVKQFINEAEIWIKLDRHPHIVQASLVKVIEGKPYIFLEYVQGTDLEKMLEAGKVPVRQALELAIQFCRGIHYAFRKLGLVHRDIKPSNCMITREGTLKITDFGLGKMFDQPSMEGAAGDAVQADTNTTSSSTTMAGTLAFMAPELFSDTSSVGVKTDIYAFGVLFYQVLIGTNPFESEDAVEVITNHLSIVPDAPAVLDSGIPAAFSDIIMKCLDKEQEGRYSDFGEILARLEELYIELYGCSYEDLATESTLTEDDWINKGISLAELARHREAIMTFDRALSLNAGSFKALIRKSESLIEVKNATLALQCLDDAMKIDKENSEIWFLRGEAFWQLGKKEHALVSYNQALEKTDVKALILGRKGKLLAELGRLDEALSCFKRALAENTRIAEIWDEKGSLLMRMNRYEEALESIREALEINPRLNTALYHQGLAFFHLGLFHDAVKVCEKALSINPDMAGAWIVIGDSQRESGYVKGAYDAYEKAITIDDKNMDVYISWLFLVRVSEQWEEGLLIVDKALSINPENEMLLLIKSECLIHLAYFSEALPICEYLCEKEPENMEAFALLSSVKRSLQEEEALIGAISENPALSDHEFCTDIDEMLSRFCSVSDACTYLEAQGPESENGRYLLAYLKAALGEWGIAMQVLDSLTVSPASGSSKLRAFVEESLSAGQQARKKGFLGGLFKKDESKKTDDPDLLLLKALGKLRDSLYSESRDIMREILLKTPSRRVVRFFIGQTYEKEGRVDKAQAFYNDFLNVMPNSPGYWKQRLLAGEINQAEEMEKAYHRWIGGFIDSYEPWMEYCIFLSEKKLYATLRIVISWLLRTSFSLWKIDRSTAQFLIIKGFLELYLGRYQSALESLGAVLSTEADHGIAIMASALCHQALGADKEVEKLFTTIMKSEELKGLPAFYLTEWYVNQDLVDKPMSMIDKAILEFPNSIFLMFRKAWLMATLKDYSGFFNYCNEIYAINRDYAPIKILRGRSLFESGKVNDAMSELSHILSSGDRNILIQKDIALLYTAVENWNKALSLYQEVQKSYGLDFRAFIGEGIVYCLMRNYKSAAGCFEEAIELNPHDPDLWQLLGAVYFHLNRFDESGSCWDIALRHRCRFVQAWINKGVFLYLRGEYTQAQEIADKVLRMEPENSSARLCKSRCLWKAGSHEEALRGVEKALSSDPQNIQSWVLRGILEYLLGDFELSFQSFDKATQIDNKDADLWYDKALLSLHAKNYSEARRSIDRALALDNSHFEALIVRFAFERTNQQIANEELLLSPAEKADEARYKVWRESYDRTGDPLNIMMPKEVDAEPFTLPFSMSFQIAEPFELLHLMNPSKIQ
ncbi:MAG: tetratricopeptide repeat protein [Candidatus Xenobiia bacterium LiM19]